MVFPPARCYQPRQLRPINQGGPVYRSAGDLLQASLLGRVSSRELVDTAILRIEALDGKLRPAASAAIVSISENDDFELPRIPK